VPLSNGTNGHGRQVSPEEGRQLLARQLLETLREQGDIASEKTWQAHAVLLLRHGEKFLEDLGMLQLLKMQQVCADMVIKIRLANRKAPEDDHSLLEEYEALMEDVFAPVALEEVEDVALEPEEDEA
jgi:hypothetical protein